MILKSIAIVVIAACLARAAGGGLKAHLLNKKDALDENEDDLGGVMPINLTMLPEVCFGLLMASYSWGHWPGVVGYLFSAAWVYGWMETGHGIAYHMGRLAYVFEGLEHAGRRRTQFLSPVMDRLESPLHLTRYSRAWCWVFMGLKGFLIGLPAGPWGWCLAVLWPACYEAGWVLAERGIIRKGKETEAGEWLTGASAGLMLCLALS